MICPGQKWTRKGGSGVGRSVARVMAITEGYVVARYTGCMPWVKHVNDFVREHELLTKHAESPTPPSPQCDEPAGLPDK
jgi:hypothetical protein